jgi:hypothetical protein
MLQLKNFAVFLALIFTGFPLAAEQASGQCVDYLVTLQNHGLTDRVTWQRVTVNPSEAAKRMGVSREFEIIQIQTKEGERLQEREVFTKPADLIIAFDSTGNTQGHMYLGIRGVNGEFQSYRYDGRLFFRDPDVTPNTWRLSDGLAIRYESIPEFHRRKMLETIDRLLEPSPPVGSSAKKFTIRAPTCVASACRLLYEFGLFKTDIQGKFPWFPSTFLRHLARTGLVTQEGTRLTPQIYTINRDYKIFWNRLPNWWRTILFIVPVMLKPQTWGLRQFKP